jgi:hypothetical protein
VDSPVWIDREVAPPFKVIAPIPGAAVYVVPLLYTCTVIVTEDAALYVPSPAWVAFTEHVEVLVDEDDLM